VKKMLGWWILCMCLIAAIVFICTLPHKKQTSQTPEKISPPSETIQISVSIPALSCPEGNCGSPITPGVPPGTIKIAGTIENDQCLDVFATNPSCWIDRSAEVIGGTLFRSYTVRAGNPYHIIYSLENQRRVDQIRVNGTLLTSFGVLGTPPYQWVVACFIPEKDKNDKLIISPNPNCTAQIAQVRLVFTGDSGGSGSIGSYTNGAYNMPYDDPQVPFFDGKKEGPIHLQTSYWEDPKPSGVWQTWAWNTELNAYTETFYSVATTQSAYFTIYNPCRNPLAPKGCHEPGFGVYVDVMPVGGGAIQCTTQLVHYEDLDPSAKNWYGAVISGINNTTHCATQGADTRSVVVAGP